MAEVEVQADRTEPVAEVEAPAAVGVQATATRAPAGCSTTAYHSSASKGTS